MEVLWIFVILQATLCSSYDLEIEGMMRVGDAFLKKLNDDLLESRKVQTTFRPEVRPIRPSEFDAGQDRKSRKTGELDRNDYRNNYIEKTMSRIKSGGSLRLNSLQIIVDKDLKLNMDISQIIFKVIVVYSDTLDKYVKNVTVHLGHTELDTEFLFLDLVETSNKLLYSIQKRIINDVVDDNKDKILQSDIIVATEKMFKQNVLDKKRQMQFICADHGVCRPFPGFTDYFADLISEVLKLNDSRLKKLLQIIRKALSSKIDFIKEIVNRRALEKIIYHFGNINADVGLVREMISILRAVIVQRHKVIVTKDDDLRNRTAAVKILFDIVDKAFENDGEDVVAMNIDIVTKVFKEWKQRLNDINVIVTDFIKYFFDLLHQNLGDSAKKEVKVITEVIFRGKTKDRSVAKYLFTAGSKFVSGVDLQIYNNFL